MTFEEYRLDGHLLYADFVAAICRILTAAVEVHDVLPHAVTGRAKSASSLRKKLIKNTIDLTGNIEKEIKDLAGARLVFLTNGQVNSFSNTGVIHDNFEVLGVNVHHPVPGTETETKLFDSTNYLVCLKPERCALPEYHQFEGLRAEIQVQTLLKHAWAEMGHDTIYKQPDLKHVGGKRLDVIKARMDKVMREYLLPAGHDFDKIARDFDQLVRADESVDETIEILQSSTDNNELGDAIEKLDDLVLPQFDDRSAQFIKVMPLLVEAVDRTRGSESATVETVFGNYAGKSGEDVARAASELIGHHLYCDPSLTFSALNGLFAKSLTPEERSVWLELSGKFSKHDLQIWKDYGPAVPRLILDEVKKLSPEDIRASRGSILKMLGNLLSAELGGVTANSMSVTFHQASVPVSDVLRDIRHEAITLLESMLDAVDSDPDRRAVLSELRNAATTPYHGGNDDLLQLIMEDGARVISIERNRASGWGLELRRWCEVDALHTHYRFGALPPHLADNAELKLAQETIVSELLALRDALNADREYGLYKTLVGHDSVRPNAWEEHPFDPDATNAWRDACYLEIVSQISDANIETWISRIRLYAAEPKTTGGELISLGECFKKLGEIKPALAARFLDVMDDNLSPLIIPILLGIDASAQRGAASQTITKWLLDGNFLSCLADYLRLQTSFDRENLVAVLNRAIEAANYEAVLGAINAAAQRFGDTAEDFLIQSVFMPAVGFMTDSKKSNWLAWAFGLHRSGILQALDENQTQRVLQSFIEVNEIDFRADHVLAIAASRFPASVYRFFDTRMHRERDNNVSRFEAIPFTLHDLQGPLSREPAMLLDAARQWYNREPLHYEFSGGRLVRNVFPNLTPEIASSIAAVVKTGNRDELAFILKTLLAFEGDAQVYPLCMDIVERLEVGDEWLSRVTDVIGRTGVVHGEFGFVEAEAQQKERLEKFLSDTRPKVVAYTTEQIRQIEQSMAWQQRRAEWDIEQRKRDWGEA